ncbi:MAG TPA: peptide-methionine (S)-S-oxide reductase MsrA [Steroidobacteraceae bacterium]|nr:peptide-methionine (S)-S-oxide reductase MsrA [Steroidobacteraceae bacterium]
MFKRLVAVSLLLASISACGAEPAVRIPAPAFDPPAAQPGLQTAVLAGGCFWGVQGVYQHLKGVKNVLSGYAGGDRDSADYRTVSGGDTGHAESVQIVYDPAQVSYGQILQVFFSVAHDPTQLNRQGPDVGTQYRSAIFYGSDAQQQVATSYIAQLDKAGVYPKRIVTRVDPLKGFYPAEDYHQDYLVNHPDQPYIAYNDLPKVRNFEALLPALYNPRPVTVASAGKTLQKQPQSAAAKPANAANGAMMAAGKPQGDAMMSGAMTSGAMTSGAMMSAGKPEGAPLEGVMPELSGATGWLNSKPLTRAGLRGKVVVIDFWTYSCINCLRSLPYVNAWYQHYKDSGLVIIGVHSPEFDFEKDPANVRKAVEKFGIRYPVAIDSNMAIWNAFGNRYWPAHYFIDADGEIRGHHFGEGKYARSERNIRKLLEEAGAKNLPDPLGDTAGEGIAAASDADHVASPETYVGFERAANFQSPGSFARNAVKNYTLPAALALNQWALAGKWKVAGEKATLDSAPGRVVFRFRARDLHLVLGPGEGRKPVRFRVLLDGKPPGDDHGMDVDTNGNGTVHEQRLYQLIRQRGAVGEHEFTIEFLDPKVEAYSFTFG